MVPISENLDEDIFKEMDTVIPHHQYDFDIIRAAHSFSKIIFLCI